MTAPIPDHTALPVCRFLRELWCAFFGCARRIRILVPYPGTKGLSPEARFVMGDIGWRCPRCGDVEIEKDD